MSSYKTCCSITTDTVRNELLELNCKPLRKLGDLNYNPKKLIYICNQDLKYRLAIQLRCLEVIRLSPYACLPAYLFVCLHLFVGLLVVTVFIGIIISLLYYSNKVSNKSVFLPTLASSLELYSTHSKAREEVAST